MPKPLCREFDPETWFPISSKDYGTIAAAKQICGLCPIKYECLERALEDRIEFGIWGGQTEEERKALLKANPHLIARSKNADHRDRTALTEALAS